MTLEHYVGVINQDFKRGISTEHSFRGYLQQLIEDIDGNR
jgi:hypothetical protein